MEGNSFFLQPKRVSRNIPRMGSATGTNARRRKALFLPAWARRGRRKEKEACAGMNPDKQMGLGEINADATPSTGTCRAKSGCRNAYKAGFASQSQKHILKTKDGAKIGG
jgi:hypothetical protein